jgi:hypothetical protein
MLPLRPEPKSMLPPVEYTKQFFPISNVLKEQIPSLARQAMVSFTSPFQTLLVINTIWKVLKLPKSVFDSFTMVIRITRPVKISVAFLHCSLKRYCITLPKVSSLKKIEISKS